MKALIVVLTAGLCFAGTLKPDDQPGVDIVREGDLVRCVTTPSGESRVPDHATPRIGQRAETMWVDRAHQNAIANHTAISGNGTWIQAGWYLNNERTSVYRSLGSNVPLWTASMPAAEWYIPVDVSLDGSGIAVGSTGEPFYCFTATSPAPQWTYTLLPDEKIATASQGPSVCVSDDGSIYAFLASGGGMGRLYILDSSGDTIRTIQFPTSGGIYGLDMATDGSVFCVSTYNAIYIYEQDGSRRDSLYNYGQTVAAMSGDGKYIASGAFNQRVYLHRFNGSDYDPVWQHVTGHPWVTAVAISDDGSTIMAGTFQYSPSNSGKVLLYDSSSATPLWEYTQYGDYVCACALSDDGSRAVAGSWGQYGGTFGDVLTVFDRGSSTPIFQVLDDIDEPGSIFTVDIANDGSFVCAGGKAVHAREMGNGGEVYSIRMLDPVADDAGVMSAAAPGAMLQVGQTITPSAVVKNYGTNTITFATTCVIYDSLDQLLYADTLTTTNLASGGEATLTFSPSWNVPAYGTYRTVFATALAGDGYPANDTLIQGSICYHDGAVLNLLYPFREISLRYGRFPRVTIKNAGSYAENIPVTCNVYDAGTNLVYSGSGQYYLNPQQSITFNLSNAWTPNDTGAYTVHAVTTLGNDYVPGNDSVAAATDVTTEIFYDDGGLDVYGYVSSDFYDNKFAVRMIPCLNPPYLITNARLYVSSADPIIVSLNGDSSGLPGLGATYHIAPPETINGVGAGWLTRTFLPEIEMTSADPFWMVAHWLSSSPAAPYVGMDGMIPRDSVSRWYWTDPGDPGWHTWYSYDFMMRAMTVPPPTAVTEQPAFDRPAFALALAGANPIAGPIRFDVTMPQVGDIVVALYDAAGRQVREIHRGTVPAGTSRFTAWPRDERARRLSAGVYFLRADFNGQQRTVKTVIVNE